jgi:phosphoglycolate phosphatase-like HAD superfamily hydrolase
MTVYKSSEDFANVRTFSGIVFDCDGVLIDSTKSYDLALVMCSREFSSLLGFDFVDEEFMDTIGKIRELGGFNNDWDSLSIMVAYFYLKSKDTKTLDAIVQISPLADRIRSFETKAIQMKNQQKPRIGFAGLNQIVSQLSEGTTREQLTNAILKDNSLVDRIARVTSYPRPVGEGLLATFYDEVVYGKRVFREMYGFDCATNSMSNPGLILHERKLVTEEALNRCSSASGGNLGIITGRPKVPTMFTLGDTFGKWFQRPELCFFTGDYILDMDEVKPSPRPMLKVAKNLSSEYPILYVGDSGEDLLMTKNANNSGLLSKKIYFAGIASTLERVRYFESEGTYVDCIVSNVNELGSVLEQNMLQSTRVGN